MWGMVSSQVGMDVGGSLLGGVVWAPSVFCSSWAPQGGTPPERNRSVSGDPTEFLSYFTGGCFRAPPGCWRELNLKLGVGQGKQGHLSWGIPGPGGGREPIGLKPLGSQTLRREMRERKAPTAPLGKGFGYLLG